MKHRAKKLNLHKLFLVVLGLMYGLSNSTEALAAPGDLDPSFGVQGRQFITVSNTQPLFGIKNRATDVVIQPDGKTLVSGYAWDPTMGDSFIIMRFNPNGNLDSSFANNGIFRYEYGSNTDQLYGIALQADGKIVAAGEVQLGNVPDTAFAVIRLNPNGTFDTSFGSNGLVITDFFNSLDQATEVAIQPDGKIIASGWVTQGGVNNGLTYDFALVRYNPNGSLDASFGNGGIVFTDFLGRGDLAKASVLQPDGKLVVAGFVAVPTSPVNYDFGLARYNTDGSLDATFGNGGKVVTAIGNNLDELARGIALAPGGKLVVAGEFYNPPVAGSGSGHRDVLVVRYNPNGSLDTSFDGDGKFVYDSNQGDRSESGEDVVVQPDGKILVAAKSRLFTESVGGGSVSHTEMMVIRLRQNGGLDNTFSNDGIAYADFGMFHPEFGGVRTGDSGTAIALQPDGKIIVPGEAVWGNGDNSFALARFLNDITSNVFRRPAFDFDGDGQADVSVFRPDSGTWYLQNSLSGFSAAQFGLSSDKLVPADYDGDGRTDLAMYRNGTWYLQRSTLGFTSVAFGASDDIPVSADYDGDGKAELAVFRPSNGAWSFYNLVNGQTSATVFGRAGDKPVQADYDGDGKADVAVFRDGTWYLQRSTLGFTAMQFGEATDTPVPADYDGDGKTDVAVFRNGTWYMQRSSLGFTSLQFGLGTDAPVPADYDGDGKTDPAVFRSGFWYLLQSQNGFGGVQFGTTGDVAIPSAHL